MATKIKIEIFDENGDTIDYEPLWSEDEVKEYFQTRKKLDPENPDRYLYPPVILNPYVLAAHKQGLEFKREMVESTQKEDDTEAEKTEAESVGKAEEKNFENIFKQSIYKIENQKQENTVPCSERQTEGFKTQCSNEIELKKLSDFPNNKFSVYEGQQLEDMVDSIKKFGVLTPLIIWKKGRKHIILSGHNRKRAAELAGLKTVPVCIKENLTDDEANLIMGETNFRQRGFSDMKHSQKAFCLKQHSIAENNCGIKKDIKETIDSQNFLQKNNADFADSEAENLMVAKIKPSENKREKLEQKYELNHATISQYIRIAELCTELLDLLDDGYIAFSAAYQLTFIDNEEIQKTIAAVIKNGTVIEAAKANKLREYFEKHKTLTEENIKEILAKRPKRSDAITIKPKDVSRFFTNGESKTQMKDVIIKALEFYFSNSAK